MPASDGTGAAGEGDGIRLRGGSSMYDTPQHGDSESPIDEEEEDDMMINDAAVGASRASHYLRQPTQPGSSAAASPHTILNTTGIALHNIEMCQNPQ